MSINLKLNDQRDNEGNELDGSYTKFKECRYLRMYFLFMTPLYIVLVILVDLKSGYNFSELINLWALAFSFLMFLPHEFIHATAFPMNTRKVIHLTWKGGYVYSDAEVNRSRFIVIALLPLLLLGVLPMIGWFLFFDDAGFNSTFLFTVAYMNCLFSVLDIHSIIQTIKTVPKEAMIVQNVSGELFWYIPNMN